MLSIFPFDPEKHLEVYISHLEPDNILESDGHREGVVEYLMVFDGSIEITIDETMYQLHKGDSMKFAADSKHSYKCISKEIAKTYTVIYYEEKNKATS